MSKGTAFLGPAGSFTHQAAMKFTQQFQRVALLVPQSSPAKIFSSVATGLTDFGVVAIENNVEGFVGETLDLLLKHTNLQVVGMVWLPIKFDAICLSTADKSSDEPIFHTVVAHPHAMAQCSNFIDQHQLAKLPALSNSAASKDLSDGQLALVPHGSNFEDRRTVYQEVQDYQHAKTQFMLIAKREDELLHTLDNTHNIWALTPKTDRQGLLGDLLKIVSKYDINVSTLISRPIKEVTNRYSFFMTLDTDFDNSSKCMHEISQLDIKCQHLGWYSKHEK